MNNPFHEPFLAIVGMTLPTLGYFLAMVTLEPKAVSAWVSCICLAAWTISFTAFQIWKQWAKPSKPGGNAPGWPRYKAQPRRGSNMRDIQDPKK